MEEIQPKDYKRLGDPTKEPHSFIGYYFDEGLFYVRVEAGMLLGGESFMQWVHKCSSYYEDGRFDKYCPVCAWGVYAFFAYRLSLGESKSLGYYIHYKEKPSATLYEEYYNMCKKRYNESEYREYVAFRLKNKPTELLDIAFCEEHIKQERSLIEKSATMLIPIHDGMDTITTIEEHFHGLLKRETEKYLEWVEARKDALLQKMQQQEPEHEIKGQQPINHFPHKLDTPEALALFTEVAKLGYCQQDGTLYKWIGTAALFGYFVDVSSNKLKIRPSNKRIPWKLYKLAFQINKRTLESAKQAVNDYANKDLTKPEGYEKILSLCE